MKIITFCISVFVLLCCQNNINKNQVTGESNIKDTVKFEYKNQVENVSKSEVEVDILLTNDGYKPNKLSFEIPGTDNWDTYMEFNGIEIPVFAYHIKNRSRNKIVVNADTINLYPTCNNGDNSFFTFEELYFYDYQNDTLSIFSYNLQANHLSQKLRISNELKYEVLHIDETSIYLADDSYFSHKIYKYHISENKLSTILDLSDKVPDYYRLTKLSVLYNNENVLLEYGKFEGDLVIDLKYFLLDVKNESIKVISQKFKNINLLVNGLEYCVFDDKNHTYCVGSMIYRDYGLSSQDDFILDSEFNIIGRALAKYIYPEGYKILNGKLQRYFIKHEDFKENRRMISYELNTDLEELFYKIYKNKEINSGELERLSDEELRLTANFIFAKYGYDFHDNLDLNFYFNLYRFYREIEKISSIKDIITSKDLDFLQEIYRKLN